jgi:hypothetical protein
MADSESAPWLRHPAAHEVADSTGGTTITVHSGAWSTLAPQLTAEAAAMLAPPVTVSAEAFGPASVARVTPQAPPEPLPEFASEPTADPEPLLVGGGPAEPPSDRRRAETMRYRMNMPSLPLGKHRRTRAG